MDGEKIKTQVKSINDALTRGIYSVKLDQHEIFYRNFDEMIKARDLCLAQLNKGKPRSKRTTAVFCRGE